jgi:hypothetical protein
MRLSRLTFLFLMPVLFCPGRTAAQDWSFRAATGPFVFGKFARQTSLVGIPGSGSPLTTSLSAAVRPGVAVDLQRELSGRWAFRLQGTFAQAPLSIKTGGRSGISLDTGKINVTTITAPLVMHINRSGAVRLHVFAGPAYAIYDLQRTAGASGSRGLHEGARGRFGVVGGGGIDWWVSKRFALSGEIDDVITSSPLHREEWSTADSGVDIPRPQNVHTSAGIRWRF